MINQTILSSIAAYFKADLPTIQCPGSSHCTLEKSMC